MPKLKVTIQKRTEDPWVLNMNQPISTVYFTEQEINDILLPYWQSVQQLTGLLSIIEEKTDDVRLVIYDFDTMENLIASKEATSNTDLGRARTQLMQQVMTRNNFQPYVVQSEVLLEDPPA